MRLFSGRRKFLFISVLAFPAAVALVISVVLQARYLREMHLMLNQHFMDLVNTAVDDAVKAVERETLVRYTDEMLRKKLEDKKDGHSKKSSSLIYLAKDAPVDTTSLMMQISTLKEWNLKIRATDFGANVVPSKMPDSTKNIVEARDFQSTNNIVDAYLFYHDILNEVVLASLIDFDSDVRSLSQKLSPELTTYHLENSLKKLGIDEPFSYKVCDNQGNILFSKKYDNKCDLEDHDVCSIVIRHHLFERLLMKQRCAGYLEIHFFNHGGYMLLEPFAYPMFIATAILVIIYILGLLFLIRQYNFEKEKKAFAQNLTHELKTPLSSIMIATDMLTGDYNPDPVMKQKLSSALKSETKRLSFLVEKVLQFTLLEEKQIFFRKESIDVHDILEETHTVYSVKCSQLGGHMNLKLDAVNHFVSGDKLHLKNVIFNLIDNAIKYRKPDVPPVVELETYNVESNQIAIAIKDNGIGISKKDRDLIFKKYYRVEQGNVHNVKGFGLGLSYVDKIVRALHGTIKVSGKKGEGTTMTVLLPVTQQNSHTEQQKNKK